MESIKTEGLNAHKSEVVSGNPIEESLPKSLIEMTWEELAHFLKNHKIPKYEED